MHGQLVMVRVLAWEETSQSRRQSQNSSEKDAAYLGDGVDAATVGNLSGLRAVGGDGGDDLRGVLRVGLAGGGSDSHEGGAGGNECVLHLG